MKVLVSVFRDDSSSDSRLFDKRRFDVQDESYLDSVVDDVKEYLSDQYFEMNEEGI